ncbi:hypothetical protein [Arsenicicoccus dermatophilus]|uniref:hypothetical protein n=1 Tax=Arsenicicoccus dermatophilus TaxID=1076331 RepID=UPI001F4CD24C|nr:hypothetical protein [Arsenicicoccus dermatophilus]MCH8614027.1 hypothetical protein [Arsenicicoccus dermatophilus]
MPRRQPEPLGRGRRTTGPLGSPAPRAALAGCATALLVTALWLWPALGRGQLLHRDFVQVPQPALGVTALGLGDQGPRGVPLDAVTALFATVVPTALQQQVMLLASLALAGCGTAVLLRRHGTAATVTAAALTCWHPYPAERLLLGQPPTLLAWAMVPWLVAAVRLDTSRARRLGAVPAAALPAALTPYGGLLALLTVALTSALTRRGRDLGVLLGLGAAWCLPWVVAGLRGSAGTGERAGAAAFAVRTGGMPDLLDVLTGGGVWAPGATLASRAGAPALVASALLMAAALGVLLRPHPRWGQGRTDDGQSGDRSEVDRSGAGREGAQDHHRDGPGVRLLLGLALLGPPSLALLLATGPGLALWGAAQAVPGVGILRDTHRWLGVSALALAVLVGLGVARVPALTSADRIRPTRPGTVLPTYRLPQVLQATATVVVLALAALSCPDAPARLHRVYRPVAWPAGWDQAVAAIGDRTTLVLPWQPLRRQGWVGPEPFLDPLPLALPGRALSSRDLAVRRDGRTLVVGHDDRRAADAWRRGDLATLRALGVQAVAVWTSTPGAVGSPPPSARQVPTTGPLQVWLLDGASVGRAPGATP